MEFQISDNKPQWREAGADTWNFFSNGNISLVTARVDNGTSGYVYTFSEPYSKVIIYATGGTILDYAKSWSFSYSTNGTVTVLSDYIYQKYSTDASIRNKVIQIEDVAVGDTINVGWPYKGVSNLVILAVD